MPRTKPKGHQKPRTNQSAASPNSPGDVLTLAETASYLRLPEAEVTRLVRAQDLPGRFTGTEWRFLKGAIQDWLRSGPAAPPATDFWEAWVGAFKDDPHMEEIVKDAYRRRGRPIAEER
jgi:excisionase family DNA binding protein